MHAREAQGLVGGDLGPPRISLGACIKLIDKIAHVSRFWYERPACVHTARMPTHPRSNRGVSGDGAELASASSSRPKMQPYTPLFAVQHGGFSYKSARSAAKPRYLDYLRTGTSSNVRAQTNSIDQPAESNVESGMDVLTADEFKYTIRSRLPARRQRSDNELYAWFAALDSDDDGLISSRECYAFALREAFLRPQLSGDLNILLSRWDGNESSLVNKDEFANIAERMGFSSIAAELLAATDFDSSGNITLAEFGRLVRERASRPRVIRFLRSQVRPPVPGSPILMCPVQRSLWRTRESHDVELSETLLEEVKRLAECNGQQIYDLSRRLGLCPAT